MSSQRARIAAGACELWERRGNPEGSPEVDWDAAEKELLGVPTRPKATLAPIQQQASDVVMNDSEGGPISSGTETTSPDGPIPKPFRARTLHDRR